MAVVMQFVDCSSAIGSVGEECSALIATMQIHDVAHMVSIVGFAAKLELVVQFVFIERCIS